MNNIFALIGALVMLAVTWLASVICVGLTIGAIIGFGMMTYQAVMGFIP